MPRAWAGLCAVSHPRSARAVPSIRIEKKERFPLEGGGKTKPMSR